MSCEKCRNDPFTPAVNSSSGAENIIIYRVVQSYTSAVNLLRSVSTDSFCTLM